MSRRRVTERAAVNALRSLLEKHDHVVQEIDGGNDRGEDLYLEFTEDGNRTGDTVRIQVKGGLSYRAHGGYRVRIGAHEKDWADANVPVLCVVYDPERDTLYWANATHQIRDARRRRTTLRTVRVHSEAALDDSSIDAFAHSVRRYVGRYRGHRVIEAQLAEMSGFEIEPTDWVEHFRNEFGEDLVFVQHPEQRSAVLLHSDLDWEPMTVAPDELDFDGLRKGGMPGLPGVPTIGDVILDMPEALWLAACFWVTKHTRQCE